MVAGLVGLDTTGLVAATGCGTGLDEMAGFKLATGFTPTAGFDPTTGLTPTADFEVVVGLEFVTGG